MYFIKTTFPSIINYLNKIIIKHCFFSVVEPEPDFFAGAEAGEKAPDPGCCYVTSGFYWGKVETILINFSHILTKYTSIVKKIVCERCE